MAGINKILTVIAGVACLLLSSESIAGKPGDGGGTSGPQDVNVVNTPTVNLGSGGPIGVDVLSLPSQPLTVITESPKSLAESQTFGIFTDRVFFTTYTPPAGKRVIIKSLLVTTNRTIGTVSLHYTGGWQSVPVDSRGTVSAAWHETTIALPEGPFYVEVSLTGTYGVQLPANLLVTFYEVPVN